MLFVQSPLRLRMEPFEQAWALLKAPLDFDSIEETRTPEGAPLTTADFYHPDPEVDRKIKLAIYGGSDMRAYPAEHFGDEHERVARARYHSPTSNDGFSLPWQAENIEVEPEAQRMGLGSAMHDLMAHQLAQEGLALHPARRQTPAGRKMWAKRLGVERPHASGIFTDDVSYEPDDTWPFLKAQVYTGELGESPPTEPGQHYEMLPHLEQMGGFMWQSEDGMARGTMRPDFWHNTLNINNFEMARPLRGQGNSRQYLQQMIDEGHGHFDNELQGTHATNVERHTADFWNKLVDEGMLDGAHQNQVRVSRDGSRHGVYAYDDAYKQPWSHELGEDYMEWHGLR